MSQFFARVLDVLIKFERLSWLSISAVPYHQITIKEWLPEIFPGDKTHPKLCRKFYKAPMGVPTLRDFILMAPILLFY